MLRKFLASSRDREDLKSAYADIEAAAQRLKRACMPEGYCPMLERADFSKVNDLRHVRNPR